MRIAIVTVGTRGDVQPYVAVGRALASRGHDVWLATHEEFEPLVRAHGLGFRPMRGGMRELLQTELGRNWLTSADQPLKYARYAKALFVPLYTQWSEDADRAVEGADAVLFYMMAMPAFDAAERRGIPAIALSPWPSAPTADYAPPTAQWANALPRPLRRASWHLLLRVLFGAFHPAQSAHRARVGLPPPRAGSPYSHVLAHNPPAVHLFSNAVVPRPRDWAPHLEVAGFAFLPSAAGYEPPAGLARFLAAGAAPVYVGFGSMTGHSPDALARLAAGAAERAGVRVVYATGWTGVAPPSSERVHVIDEAPHDWLFPRVAAVVHHGGAGTFAAGLRAGRPTVIAPFFGDQTFWAGMNARLGTGPSAPARKDLTEERLAYAIRRALDEPAFARAAAHVAERLAHEDGAARAAELIERRLRA